MFVNPLSGGFTIVLDANEIGKAEAEVASWLEKRGLPAAWAQVGITFQDAFLLLLRDAIRYPDGSLGTYIRVSSQWERGPGTAILPHYQGQILLLSHFRHATRNWHLEIPRGYGTRGLSLNENARKELKEEVGAVTSRLVSLGQVHPDTGMTSDVTELFYADIESYTGIEELEGVARMVPVAVTDFEQLIRDSKITDTFTVAAYARAKLQGLL